MERKYLFAAGIVLIALIIVVFLFLMYFGNPLGQPPLHSLTDDSRSTPVQDQNKIDSNKSALPVSETTSSDANSAFDSNSSPQEIPGVEECGNTICEPIEMNSGSCAKDCE